MPTRGKRTPPPRRVRAAGSGRIVVLLLVLLATFTVIAARLTWLQTAEAGEFARRAESQRTQEIVLTPRRGAILDREGQPLAISADAKTVFAMRQSVSDPKAAASMLARYLGGSEAKYLAKLGKKRGFVYIERKVPMERAVPLQKALLAAKIQGICFADDSRRIYPCGDLACQILGFVGVDDRGLAGIEDYYNDVLGGKPGGRSPSVTLSATRSLVASRSPRTRSMGTTSCSPSTRTSSTRLSSSSSPRSGSTEPRAVRWS